jgi:cytochrome P450
MPLAVPQPDNRLALHALRAMIRERSVLMALEIFHAGLGDVFQLKLPGFSPVMLVGPEAVRFVLVSAREGLRWRSESDPITRLLRHGLLVEDGDIHDTMRSLMNPALHKQMLGGYVESMWRRTDQVTQQWAADQAYDMLVEMRRIALLVLFDTLFKADFSADLDKLWRAILKSLQYISPGVWVISPHIPRPSYRRALREMDEYLFELIRLRRQTVQKDDDLFGLLLATPGVDDNLVRDQLLTMIIAGHDTSTALLSWVLYLLGKHPDVMRQAQAEVGTILDGSPPRLETVGQLVYLEQVINETLRLYPPAHLGSRIALADLEFGGYHIPAGTRVTYSIYLTHRMKAYWDKPARFDPERFSAEHSRQRLPYTFIPFGGGPRLCIGAAYALVEVKVILARLLQTHNFTLAQDTVHVHMGATLEPRPGVRMSVSRH